MKKALMMFAVLFMLLPCSGCTSDTSSSAAEKSETMTSTRASDTSAAAETKAVTSDTTVTTADTEMNSEPDESTVTAGFQGGIGGEQNAETPKPEFFIYRFQPDAFSARLAGGNYQTVACDLSAAFAHQIDAEYFLEDYDQDGCYDLYIPASYDADSRVLSYYVFCWDSAAELFRTEPLTVNAETNT